MDKKIQSIKDTAKERTWVTFLYDTHPFSLLHWSISGTELDQKDVWLLQDEVTFEIKEFLTLDEAIAYIEESMKEILEIL